MAGIGQSLGNMIAGTWSNKTANTIPIGSQYINTVSTGTGAARTSAGVSIHTDRYDTLKIIEDYVALCGDKLEYIRLSDTIETSDSKISMLKLLKVGEYLKDVGLRFDDNTYYVIREKQK